MDERTTDPPAGDASAPQPPVPRTGEDGKPVYDQEFFLALARCGRDVWNRWRETNPVISPTFRGVDFTTLQNAIIDFSEFIFGEDADFSFCRFQGGRGWLDVVYSGGYGAFDLMRGHRASFSPGMPKFTGAVFGDGAKFSNAYFGENADFSGAVFGRGAGFSNAVFGLSANFLGAAFGPYAAFAQARFGDGADFSCATFEDVITFEDAVFGKHVDFSGAAFGQITRFTRAAFPGGALFDALSQAEWRKHWSSATAKTWSSELKRKFEKRCAAIQPWEGANHGVITFSRATFGGVASFLRRSFKRECSFTYTTFLQPPNFYGCEHVDRIDLFGARIRFSGKLQGNPNLSIPNWTTDSSITLQLRALRGLASDTNNHDLERDLYIEERKAERGVLLSQYWGGGWRSLLKPSAYSYCLWIVVMAAYWFVADYGRSFVRPLAALGLSVPLLWWAYFATLIPPTDPLKLADFHRATWAFAISNAVPFVGALTLERDVKLTLLCGDRPIDAQHAQASGQPICVPIPGRRFQLLALGQSIFSALCIFFAGLALRNYFKLR